MSLAKFQAILVGIRESMSRLEKMHETEIAEERAARDDARLIAISASDHDMAHALAEAWGVDMADADEPGGLHEKAGEAKRRWILRQGEKR